MALSTGKFKPTLLQTERQKYNSKKRFHKDILEHRSWVLDRLKELKENWDGRTVNEEERKYLADIITRGKEIDGVVDPDFYWMMDTLKEDHSWVFDEGVDVEWELSDEYKDKIKEYNLETATSYPEDGFVGIGTDLIKDAEEFRVSQGGEKISQSAPKKPSDPKKPDTQKDSSGGKPFYEDWWNWAFGEESLYHGALGDKSWVAGEGSLVDQAIGPDSEAGKFLNNWGIPIALAIAAPHLIALLPGGEDIAQTLMSVGEGVTTSAVSAVEAAGGIANAALGVSGEALKFFKPVIDPALSVASGLATGAIRHLGGGKFKNIGTGEEFNLANMTEGLLNTVLGKGGATISNLIKTGIDYVQTEEDKQALKEAGDIQKKSLGEYKTSLEQQYTQDISDFNAVYDRILGSEETPGYLKEARDAALSQYKPYTEAGQRALGKYESLVDQGAPVFKLSDLETDPIYKDATRLLNQQLASRGLSQSPSEVAARQSPLLADLYGRHYAKDFAEYSSERDKYTSQLGGYSNLINLGAQGASASAGLEERYGTSRSNIDLAKTRDISNLSNIYTQNIGKIDAATADVSAQQRVIGTPNYKWLSNLNALISNLPPAEQMSKQAASPSTQAGSYYAPPPTQTPMAGIHPLTPTVGLSTPKPQQASYLSPGQQAPYGYGYQ